MLLTVTETNRRSYKKIAERYFVPALKAFANVSAFRYVIAHNDRTIKIVVVRFGMFRAGIPLMFRLPFRRGPVWRYPLS